MSLQTKDKVCPRCDGKGSHVNPNIDGDGLSQDDFIDDDFAKNYSTGVYDIRCEACHGNGKINEDEDEE